MSNQSWLIVGAVVIVALGIGFFSLRSDSTRSENVVKVAHFLGDLESAPFIVALEQGFFAENNVEVESIPMDSVNVDTALLSGQVDVVLDGPIDFFLPMSQKAPVKMIGPMSASPMYLMVRPDGLTETFADLEGKTFGITPGGTSDYALRKAARQEGVDTEKFEFMILDKTNKPIALMQSKVIDVVAVRANDMLRFIKLGAVIHNEWDSKGYSDQQDLNRAIIIREEFTNQHTELVEGFLDALIEGHRFIKNNPEEASQIIATHLKEQNNGIAGYTPEDIVKEWTNRTLTHLLWQDPQIVADTSNLPLEDRPNGLGLQITDIFDLRFQEKLSNAQREIYNTR